MKLRHLNRLLVVIITCLLLSACSQETPSAENMIRQLITEGVQQAEARNTSAIKKLIADNYKDETRRDKTMIGRLLMGYFLAHQSIHLFSYIKDIKLSSDTQAEAQLFVAMTGQPVTTVDSFMNVRAQLYLFELKFIKEDDWRVNSAKWRPALPSEILSQKMPDEK